MKHIQFTFQDLETFRSELEKIRQWLRSSLHASVLLHLLTETTGREHIDELLSAASEVLPDAQVVGCSANGSIVNGDYSSGNTACSCLIFEYPDSRAEVFQYPLNKDNQQSVTESLLTELERRSWIKGVEMLATIRGLSVSTLCQGLSRADPSVQFFGGGALSSNMESNRCCVFSSEGGWMEKGIVFVLYGGENFHLKTDRVTGWKPLGSYLTVTAAEGLVMKELNGQPAYLTYRRYLHIPNDDNFYANTREFPFFYDLNGINILRAPVSSTPEGYLIMSSDVQTGTRARLAYGDPQTILESSLREAETFQDFAPETFLVFSCAGRRTFWGNSEVGSETESYQILAPTFGFYTSGEFLRTGSYVNQHNVTQVLAAMREGEPKSMTQEAMALKNRSRIEKVSMIRRLATFVKVTTDELERANQKLQEANRTLSELATTDTLTGVGNKNAYLEAVKTMDGAIRDGTASFAVAVFDLNGLKVVNDQYGHEKGDLVIREISSLLEHVFARENLYRIGGDEFIAVLPRSNREEMSSHFHRIHQLLEAENQREREIPLSLSKGFSVFDPEADSEYHQVFRRADNAMYLDKEDYYKTHERMR